MKVSLFSEKKNAWSNLETLIVLVSFLLTATDESASARNVQIVGTTQKKKKKKKALGTGREGEETLLSPSSFPLLFSLHSMASARSNAAIHKENFFIPQYHELMIKGL